MSKTTKWICVGIAFACAMIALFIYIRVRDYVPSWESFATELKSNYEYVHGAFYEPKPVTTGEIRLGIMLKREITESEFRDVSRFVRNYLGTKTVVEEFMQYFERVKGRKFGAVFVDIYVVPATDFQYTIAARLEPDYTFQDWGVNFNDHGFEELETDN